MEEAKKESLRSSILNLHDVFLNASLQRKMMFESPLFQNPMEFEVSDRARFERTWVFFMYVFFEAWNSKNAKPLKKFLKQELALDSFDILFKRFYCSGLIKEMEKTRDYMAHRDRQSYWSAGRTSFYGRLTELNSFHDILSEIHLFAFERLEYFDSVENTQVLD